MTPEQERTRLLEAVLNDTAVVVELTDCACCGDLRRLETTDGHSVPCVHCTDAGGPCLIDGCPYP